MAKQKSPQRVRRKFTDEFEAEVVELVRDGGQSVPEVSCNLDLTESAVRNGLERLQPSEESHISGAGGEELKRLRAENKRLRQERDIPTKAFPTPLSVNFARTGPVEQTSHPSAPATSPERCGPGPSCAMARR